MIHRPAEIACGGFVHRARHAREIGGNMVLETALTDVAKKLLQSWDAHHAGPAEREKRIVGKFAFAHVTANGALAIAG